MATTANVDIREEGSSTVFTVTPGGARRQASMIIFGALFLWAALSWREMLGSVLAFTSGVIGVILLVMGLRDQRPASHRRQSVIRVSKEGFDVNGRNYPRTAVKRLMVRNPLKTDEKPRVYVYNIIAPSAGGAVAPLAPNMELEREWDALVDGVYEIVLDANHQDTVIAGNLSAQSVDRLLRSLCDVSGMAYTKG